MNCRLRISLQSRAALLQVEIHMFSVQMDLHQYLTHKGRMHRENDIGLLEILHASVDVRSVFGLSVKHPVSVLIERFVVRPSFGDIWLVELKPCVTYSLPVCFNRSMSGACTSVVSVFPSD